MAPIGNYLVKVEAGTSSLAENCWNLVEEGRNLANLTVENC